MRGRNAILGVAGAVGLSIALGIGGFLKFGKKSGEVPPSAEGSAEHSAKEIAQRISGGDADALTTFRDHLVAVGEDGQASTLTEEATDDAAALIDGSARGFRKFGTVGRAMIAGMAGCLLERLAAEPAPSNWSQRWSRSTTSSSLALADPEVQVRAPPWRLPRGSGTGRPAGAPFRSRRRTWGPGRTPSRSR
ncbi:MAG: hypothetical protein U0800_12145 [Isosphaeraceae bacterium]